MGRQPERGNAAIGGAKTRPKGAYRWKQWTQQNKNFVELYIPSDISNKVNGEKLFMVLYSINPKLSLRYFNKEIIIKLNLINLDKHYVYYLVPVLEEIINEVE